MTATVKLSGPLACSASSGLGKYHQIQFCLSLSRHARSELVAASSEEEDDNGLPTGTIWYTDGSKTEQCNDEGALKAAECKISINMENSARSSHIQQLMSPIYPNKIMKLDDSSTYPEERKLSSIQISACARTQRRRPRTATAIL
ncbi:hypothetical protein NQ318_007060 [Aromia moschata]|uniref:Uncharacterized protein n=1 Tax=Aromia moschata TaxID=1265417 RepID=A0AAV8XC09_9CUCU|nr:hypothetical protein NQ318_007060 [Aromia moschata]